MSGAHTAESRLAALDALSKMHVSEMSKSAREAKTGALTLAPGGSGQARDVVITIAKNGATVYGPKVIDPSKSLRIVYGPEGGPMAASALRQKGWCRLIGPDSVDR